MPNQPRPDNKARTVRVDDDLWNAALATAEDRGDILSEEIRRFLKRYAIKRLRHDVANIGPNSS